MFKRLVRNQEAFHALSEFVSSRSGALQVFKRIADLVSLNTDVRYEHPYDTALATYVMSLDSIVSKYAESAALLVLEASQIWWSRNVASDILSRGHQQEDRSDVERVYGAERDPVSVDWTSIAQELDSLMMMRTIATYLAPMWDLGPESFIQSPSDNLLEEWFWDVPGRVQVITETENVDLSVQDQS